MAGKLLDLAFVPAFGGMAWQLFSSIDRHGVDVLFSDHWYYLTPLLTDASLAELFLHQHGPHRQGVGFMVTSLIADATDLDLRAESFGIGVVLCLACILALWLKRRMVGKFQPTDAVIPVLFLTPQQWEAVTGVPNPAHGAVPLCLLMALGLAFTVRRVAWRDPLILGLHLCLVYTGFGIFAGGSVLLLLGLELRRAVRHPDGRRLRAAVVLLAAATAAAAFFIDYRFAPAVPDFRFPDPDWPNYPTLIARALANFVHISGPAAIPLGLAILGVAGWTAWHHLAHLARGDHGGDFGADLGADRANASPRHTTIALLVTFSLLFVLNMAIGRISLGTDAGAASRYVPLLVPLFFGLYLQATLLPARWRRIAMLGTLVLHGYGSVWPHADIEAQATAFARRKTVWRDTYLATGSTTAADTAAGGSIHPAGFDGTGGVNEDLEEKLQFLETRRLSFFRTRSVARRLDPQLIGSWRPVDAATAGIVALNGDGTYRFASGIPADTGHWKVRDGVLFVRRRSSLTWLPLGGYSLAGDRLVLRPAADRPELIWRRQ